MGPSYAIPVYLPKELQVNIAQKHLYISACGTIYHSEGVGAPLVLINGVKNKENRVGLGDDSVGRVLWASMKSRV